jgi:hypothetical protein
VLDRGVDAGGDVARLLADRYRDAARVAVEAGLARGVADAVDDSAHDAGDVDVAVGADLAGDVHEARRDEGLHGDATAGSSASRASRIESEIWSQILSGWPSVTDSEVNRRSAHRGSRIQRARTPCAADPDERPRPDTGNADTAERHTAPRHPDHSA